jgi:hypothetical protein
MLEDGDVTGLGLQHLEVEHQQADEVDPPPISNPATGPAFTSTSSYVAKMPTATEMNAKELANT